MEDGFYPDLDEHKHGYFAEDPDYFDNQEYDPLATDFDSRKDRDCNPKASLHIALDYNRRIHPLVVCQDNGTEIRAIKGLHSLYPQKLKDVLYKFIDYYKFHKEKVVYYWYDHTAVGGENETAKCEDVINILQDADWTVIPMYIGKAPGHETKFRMWGRFLTEDDYYQRVFRANRENCDKLLTSMGLAEAEQRKDGFGKDKKSEHDPNFPADESTHYSDAIDQIVYGMLECDGLSYEIQRAGYNMIMTH